MKIETLKKLIEFEYDSTAKISIFKEKVFELLDLYQQDNETSIIENTSFPLKFGFSPPPPPPDRIMKEGEKPIPPPSMLLKEEKISESKNIGEKN